LIEDNCLFSLRGKTALVTGGTGHLGQVISRVLAANGAHVIVNSRRAEKAKVTTDLISKGSGSAEAAVFDVANPSEIADYFSKRRLDKLHVVINCAYAGGGGNIQTATADDYLRSYKVSVVASQSVFSAALPAMRRAVAEDEDASVINISSMYGIVSPKLSNYAAPEVSAPPFHGAAKAALLQWTRYAACEFAQERIRINAISPGPFPSPEAEAKDPALMQRLSTNLPLGRMGRSDEIRSAVMFLASPASSFVTGANIVVDGGWTSW
jgi:NAD(P)-dependent dehydrogenase (short-subunit alcohol dehydrogenase family)